MNGDRFDINFKRKSKVDQNGEQKIQCNTLMYDYNFTCVCCD